MRDVAATSFGVHRRDERFRLISAGRIPPIRCEIKSFGGATDETESGLPFIFCDFPCSRSFVSFFAQIVCVMLIGFLVLDSKALNYEDIDPVRVFLVYNDYRH